MFLDSGSPLRYGRNDVSNYRVNKGGFSLFLYCNGLESKCAEMLANIRNILGREGLKRLIHSEKGICQAFPSYV